MGALPASGTLQASQPIARLAPGFDTFTVYTQLLVVTPTGALVLGGWSAMTVVNQIF